MARKPLLIALLVVALTCITQTVVTAETTLTFTYWGNPAALRLTSKLIEEYERQRPGVRIEAVGGPSQGYTDRIQSMMIAGIPIDVMMIDTENTMSLADQGLLFDLGEFMSRGTSMRESDFIPGALRTGQLHGIQYSMPRNWGTLALYFRTDHFEEHGLSRPSKEWGAADWRWNDFEEMIRRLTIDVDGDGTPERFGTGFHVTSHRSFPFVYQNGGFIYDLETNSVGVGSPLAVEAMEWALGLIERQLATPSNSNVLEAGTASTVIGQVAQRNSFDSSEISWDVVPLPWQKKPATVLTGSSYAIPESSQHKDLAWDFIQFLLSAEIQEQLLSELSLLPVHRETAMMASQNYPGFDVLAESLVHSFIRPNWLPGTDLEIVTLWQDAMRHALDGATPVRSALEEMAALMRAALGQQP